MRSSFGLNVTYTALRWKDNASTMDIVFSGHGIMNDFPKNKGFGMRDTLCQIILHQEHCWSDHDRNHKLTLGIGFHYHNGSTF